MTSPHHFLAEMIDREIAAGARMDGDYFITVAGTAFGETALTTAGMRYAQDRLAARPVPLTLDAADVRETPDGRVTLWL